MDTQGQMPKRATYTTRVAVLALIDEARDTRPATNASVKRIMRVCKKIGIEGDDLRAVLARLEICRYDTGEPYRSSNIKRIW
jgi:hypothetical protein